MSHGDALDGLDLTGLADASGNDQSEQLSLPPLTINWRELSDGEAREVWNELRSWVEWACDRYQLPDQVVPQCWWKHPYLVEELSALFAAWMAFYDVADTGTGPISWLERLANSKTRMRDAYGNACARGHTAVTSRTWEADPEWESWISATHGRNS